jgi:hypothetical protein
MSSWKIASSGTPDFVPILGRAHGKNSVCFALLNEREDLTSFPTFIYVYCVAEPNVTLVIEAIRSGLVSGTASLRFLLPVVARPARKEWRLGVTETTTGGQQFLTFSLKFSSRWSPEEVHIKFKQNYPKVSPKTNTKVKVWYSDHDLLNCCTPIAWDT